MSSIHCIGPGYRPRYVLTSLYGEWWGGGLHVWGYYICCTLTDGGERSGGRPGGVAPGRQVPRRHSCSPHGPQGGSACLGVRGFLSGPGVCGQVSGAGCPGPGVWGWVSGAGCLWPGVWGRVSGAGFIMCPGPCLWVTSKIKLNIINFNLCPSQLSTIPLAKFVSKLIFI